MAFVRGSTNNLTIDDADLTLLNGNVHARGLTIAGIQVSVTHGLQTVSNVSNSTSNTIQFTNDTTGFVTTANAEIGKDLLVSGNVHVSSNASIAVDSNIVAEYTGPHGRGVATLKKFPEIIFEDGKFDANDTTNTYTQAGYTVTANATHENRAHEPWVIFNGNFTANDEWQISTNLGGDRYSETDGTYNSGVDLAGSTVADQTYNGDWVQVSLPQRIKLSHMNLGTGVDYGDSRMPEEGVLLGSNNGTTWSNVLAFGQTSYQHSVFTKIDVNSSDYYSYYRMIWLKITAGNDSTHRNRASLALWELYGYEEDPPAGDTSVDTTFTSVMNTPQTGGVKVYVDGPTLENKVVGPTPVGTSATYNSTDKYWELTGTLVSNISVEANTFLEGDAPHSVSVWFNSSNLEANASKSCVFSVSDQEKLDSVNLDLQSNTWHNLTYAYQGEGGSRVTYLDGRKVSEDQAEDTFGEYPPFAMTGYSQGGYVVSSSGELGTTYQAWNAFMDGSTNQTLDEWTSAYTLDAGGLGPIYTDGSGDTAYSYGTGRNNSIGGIRGEWIKIKYPMKVTVSSIDITTDHTWPLESPRRYTVLGSDDDLNWTIIRNVQSGDGNGTSLPASTTPSAGLVMNGLVNAKRGYTYIAIVVTQLSNYNYYVRIPRIRIYGHRENDLVHLPDPTRVLKYPHIAMTGPAQRGYVATASSNYSVSSGLREYGAFTPAGTGYGEAWISASGNYSSVNGTYTASPQKQHHTGSAVGEWLQIEMPHKIQVNTFILQGRPEAGNSNQGLYTCFKNAEIWGSEDGTTWVEMVSSANFGTFTPSTLTQQHTLTVNSTNSYKYFAIIVTSTNAQNTNAAFTFASIGEWQIFGTGVDSVPIQIGGGNIDKVANFRVYDKFIDQNQALEIWDAQKDEFGRAKSSMTLHKGRLGIGTTEPEGRLAVLDEPNGIEEFPPRAMTADETYFEGHGVFKVSVSSVITTNYEGWRVFDEYTNSNGTNDPSGRWTALNSTSTIGSLTGKWVKLELPYRVKFSKIGIFPPSYSGGSAQCPTGFSIIASHDNKTWTTLKTLSNYTWKEFAYNYITFENDGYFKYIAIVATTDGGNPNTSFQELKYFGTREQGQSVLHDGQLTLTKSLNVPRIGPPPDADDTPRRDRLVVEYNTSTNPTFEGAVRDTSGRGNDGVFYGGASYDPNDKAITLSDGTDDYVESGKTIIARGTPQHTFSFWLKPSAGDHDDTATHYLVVWGSETAQNKWSAVALNNDGQLAHIYHSSAKRTITKLIPSVGTWYHVVVIVKSTSATTAANRDIEIYVDGELYTGTYDTFGTNNASAAYYLDWGSGTSTSVRLGSLHNFAEDSSSSLSNIKLYDCALTASEVKTLYDMGRLSNTIKTPLQIEAPVDIRGDIRYITNIRPLPKQTMWDHEANGHFTRGIYPITGTQGGSKVYNMLCEPDWCGGGWMCAAQIPRGKDVVTTTINLFEDEYGDPSNLTWSSDFAVPMNIFSNNSGYDLDVMLVLLGGTQAGRAGAGGARNGGIYRGVNLTQALNTGWPTNGVYPVNISTSGLASSADGYNFVSRTPTSTNFQPYKDNAGWRLSFSSRGGYDMAYNDADINTMGWLIHTGGNSLQYTYSYVHGGGGAQDQSGGNTSWAAVRFFVRPKRY